MNIFKTKTEAHEHLIENLQKKIENENLCDRLHISYARFTEWLAREYPEAISWQQNSLNAAVEPWFFTSCSEYAAYTGYPERTCQRYAVKGEDYKVFCGRFVSCQASADQFKQELDEGLRGNRPRTRWTDVS